MAKQISARGTTLARKRFHNKMGASLTSPKLEMKVATKVPILPSCVTMTKIRSWKLMTTTSVLWPLTSCCIVGLFCALDIQKIVFACIDVCDFGHFCMLNAGTYGKIPRLASLLLTAAVCRVTGNSLVEAARTDAAAAALLASICWFVTILSVHYSTPAWRKFPTHAWGCISCTFSTLASSKDLAHACGRL